MSGIRWRETNQQIHCGCGAIWNSGDTHADGQKEVSYYTIGGIVIVKGCCDGVIQQAVIENADIIVKILSDEVSRLSNKRNKMRTVTEKARSAVKSAAELTKSLKSKE